MTLLFPQKNERTNNTLISIIIMDRKILLSDLQTAVTEAYEKYRVYDTGEATADSRVEFADPKAFGIAVTLTDGTVIAAGDSDKAVPMTTIAKLPVMLTLLTQSTLEDIIQRAGMCKCGTCGCQRPAKPKVPVSAKGIRAMSMLQPTGDPEGKWDILINNLIGIAGSEVTLDDGFFQKMMGENKSADTENLLADANYYLYDDAQKSIELYTKMMAMTASAEQLSAMGATIAADGYNPLTKANVFDGNLAQRLVGFIAAKGPHKMAKPWLMLTGLPALSGYAGTMVGVMPGVMGIAAYSPVVNGAGISIRSARAIAEIMNRLELSAFSSSRVTVSEK